MNQHSKKPEGCPERKKMRSSIKIPQAKETTEISKIPKEIESRSELVKKNTGTEGMKLYQCPECPNQYNQKKSLVKHKFMHTGKFKCPRCEAPFIEKSKLDIHTRNPDSCRQLFFYYSSQKVYF